MDFKLSQTSNTYNLETHLENLGSQYKEYQDLYASWCLNKKACIHMLQTVVVNYPHFSIHDVRHSDTLLTNIELLLSEKRIKQLSPTDTWLLLHAAYTHDLGMVLYADEIERVWKTKEFWEYLSQLKYSMDKDLSQAAKLICEFSEEDKTDRSWALQIRYAVTQIVEDYFRKEHGAISQDHIYNRKDISIDQSGLIPHRLILILGDIAALHTKPFYMVMKLDKVTNGFGTDYVHPRFLAELLRLGDLLDVDNGRFSQVFEKVGGKLPEVSAAHKEKHNATRHLLITPEIISYRGDCPTRESYIQAREFVTWLKRELNYCTMNWTELIPENFSGHVPRLGKVELFYKGKRDLADIVDMHFKISQEKAFQIMEGSNIYEDPFVFIREVIQNAQDATKIQLWQDLKENQYEGWIKDISLQRLQPFEITEEVYNNYAIKVQISVCEDGDTLVKITDRGTGISVEGFKQMCHVGESYYVDSKRKKEIESMPNWLRPTGGFGIGLQSIFLIADEFTIDTRASGQKTIHAEIQSRKKGSYLHIEEANQDHLRGTTISVKIRKNVSFKYSLVGKTWEYIEENFDYFSEIDYSLIMRVLDGINTYCEASLFPLIVLCPTAIQQEKSIDTIELIKQKDIDKWKKEGNYSYELLNNYNGISAWENNKAIYIELKLKDLTRYESAYTKKVSFKGISVSNNINIDQRLGLKLDCYGLETKESITLDRKKLTSKVKEELSSEVEEVLNLYLDKTIEQLQQCKSQELQKENTEFYPDTFLFFCINRKKWNILKKEEFLELCEQEYNVFEKTKEKTFVKEKKTIQQLLPLEKKWFLSLEGFQNSLYTDTNSKYDYGEMLKQLNKNFTQLDSELIIADEILEDMVLKFNVIEYQKQEEILLYKIGKENNCLLQLPNNKYQKYILGCTEKNDEMKYIHQYSKSVPMRYAIPAIDKFPNLAVNKYLCGLKIPSIRRAGDINWICSPISREDGKRCMGYKKEEFVKYITLKPEFEKIIEYVITYHIGEKEPSREEIEKEYKQLIEDYYNARKQKQSNNKTD